MDSIRGPWLRWLGVAGSLRRGDSGLRRGRRIVLLGELIID